MWREQQRGVGDVAGERAGLVERRGEGDHPVAADRAVGRLEADDPAQRGGLADRAAGVGARAPTARGRRRPRRRCRRDEPPGHARAVPRVEHRAEGGVLVRRAHRELVLVGLAEQRRARLGEARDDRRRVRRAVALEDPRARLARHALGAEEVLDGERHAARAAPSAVGASGASSATHSEGVELVGRGARRGRPRTARARSRSPRSTAPAACAAVRRRSSALMPCGLGTRKPPSCDVGRLRERDLARQARAAARRGAARSATSTTCVVGGTPSRSSSPIFSMWSRIATARRPSARPRRR